MSKSETVTVSLQSGSRVREIQPRAQLAVVAAVQDGRKVSAIVKRGKLLADFRWIAARRATG